MEAILIAYASKCGSTAEMAEFVGKEIGSRAHVEVQPAKQVTSVAGYTAVIVGAPMMVLNWHAEALDFLARHQQALASLPVAYFLTALSLTEASHAFAGDAPTFVDPGLVQPPKYPAKLSFKEAHTTADAYLAPAMVKAPAVRPVSVAYFAGCLDYGKLGWFDRLFVRVLIGAKAADRRNWSAVRSWATQLAPLLASTRELPDTGETSREREAAGVL